MDESKGVWDEQLQVESALSLCEWCLLRPARIPGEAAHPIVGSQLDRAALQHGLAPVMALAGLDQPRDDEELEDLLKRAVAGFLDYINAATANATVPRAAEWTAQGRDACLEHLRAEFDDLRAGRRAQQAWEALPTFGEHGDALFELAFAGYSIKLRSLSSFFTRTPQPRFKDELGAALFLPAGDWDKARDPTVTANLSSYEGKVDKQFAHLTLTRPDPNSRGIYRYGFPDHLLDVEALLLQWSRLVDPNLLPSWWPEWIAAIEAEHAPKPHPGP